MIRCGNPKNNNKNSSSDKKNENNSQSNNNGSNNSRNFPKWCARRRTCASTVVRIFTFLGTALRSESHTDKYTHTQGEREKEGELVGDDGETGSDHDEKEEKNTS